jgi:hypothetical protein
MGKQPTGVAPSPSPLSRLTPLRPSEQRYSLPLYTSLPAGSTVTLSLVPLIDSLSADMNPNSTD